ncbi:MAG: carbon starvation protein A, partial [Nitrospirota bacterium]|nr:carbon starvation protein A [Nitrospirota bacterium]
VYCFLAAGVPVWLLLQPRDLINSFVLYLGIVALLAATIGGGMAGVTMNFPPLSLETGTEKLGMIWPFLFITVACGAISGFHSMVTGGTVAKQVSRESHARTIGYGGMLLESLLAVTVVVAVGGGLQYAGYLDIVFPAEGKSNPILAFSLGMGTLLNHALGISAAAGTIFGILMVEGFVITTLDAAVRLNRYLLEELWSLVFVDPPALMKSYYFNAGLSVILMFYLAYSQKFLALWPIFGAGNQLLATLTLIAVSLWLVYRGRAAWFTIVPAIFMMATTLTALYRLLVDKYLPSGNMALVAADACLMFLAVGVIVLSVRRWTEIRREQAAAPRAMAVERVED